MSESLLSSLVVLEPAISQHLRIESKRTTVNGSLIESLYTASTIVNKGYHKLLLV